MNSTNSLEIQSYLKTETLRIQKILLETFQQPAPPLKTDYQIQLFIAEKVSLKTRKKLGQILFQHQRLQLHQLEQALLEQQQSPSPKKKLGEILLEKGFISEDSLSQALAEQHEIPYWSQTTLNIPETLLQDFSAKIDIRKYLLVPVAYDSTSSPPKWTLATSSLDLLQMDTLSILLPHSQIEWVLTSPSILYSLQEKYFPIPSDDRIQLLSEISEETGLADFASSLDIDDIGGGGAGGPPHTGHPKPILLGETEPSPAPPQPQKAKEEFQPPQGYGGPIPGGTSEPMKSSSAFPPPRQVAPKDFPPFPEAKPAVPAAMPPFPPPKPAPKAKEAPPPPEDMFFGAESQAAPAFDEPPTPSTPAPPPPPPPPPGSPPSVRKASKKALGGIPQELDEDGRGRRAKNERLEPPELEFEKGGMTRAGGIAPREDLDGAILREQEEQKQQESPKKKKMKKDELVSDKKERAVSTEEVSKKPFFEDTSIMANIPQVKRPYSSADDELDQDWDEADDFENISMHDIPYSSDGDKRDQDWDEAEEKEGKEELKRLSTPVPKTETALPAATTTRLERPEKFADVQAKRKPSVLTFPFRFVFHTLLLPFKIVGGFVALADEQAEQFHERLGLLVLYMAEGISGQIVREVGESPWFEKWLGSDAGQPGPFERFVAQFRFLLHIFQMTIGTHFVLFAHFLDIIIEFIASYIHTIFQTWNISKTLARAAKRKLSNTEIEEICREFLKVKKLLSRVFVFSEYKIDPEEDPTFPLELVLETRHQLAEMKRDLSMLTEKQIQNFVKEQASERFKALLPNPLDLFPAFKDLFLLMFFVKYSRQEIEKMYIDLIHSYRRMIQLKASSLGYDLEEGKISFEPHDHHFLPLLQNTENNEDLEIAINATREKIQRLIQTLCRAGQYFDARKWSRYDLIRENSKIFKSISPHPKFELEFNRWLTREVEKNLKKKGFMSNPAELLLQKKEATLLKEKLKKQKRQDYYFL